MTPETSEAPTRRPCRTSSCCFLESVRSVLALVVVGSALAAVFLTLFVLFLASVRSFFALVAVNCAMAVVFLMLFVFFLASAASIFALVAVSFTMAVVFLKLFVLLLASVGSVLALAEFVEEFTEMPKVYSALRLPTVGAVTRAWSGWQPLEETRPTRRSSSRHFSSSSGCMVTAWASPTTPFDIAAMSDLVHEEVFTEMCKVCGAPRSG